METGWTEESGTSNNAPALCDNRARAGRLLLNIRAGKAIVGANIEQPP